MDASGVELRVLGCLIEKQRTTPDVYPLSLNSLRLACNQSTNRDPVVEYDEPMIRSALEQLSRRGWVRLASGPGSRAAKYRHLLDDALDLSGAEISLLAVLMLRGPQTPGELKQRTERMHSFASFEEIDSTITGLIERDLVAHRDRRPGQKEARFAQLLGGEQAGDISDQSAVAGARSSRGDDRLDELERRVERLEDELAEVRAAIPVRGQAEALTPADSD